MSAKQGLFWFVTAQDDIAGVCLAVHASTARSARVQARKRLGPTFVIDEPSPVAYPHAWVIDLNWQPGAKGR